MSSWADWAKKLANDPRRRRSLTVAVSLMGLYILMRKGGQRAAASSAVKAQAGKSLEKVRVPFSEFLQLIEKKQVDKVFLGMDVIEFASKAAGAAQENSSAAVEKVLYTNPIRIHPGLIELLHEKGIPFDELIVRHEASPGSPLRSLLMILLPSAYIAVVLYVLKMFYDQTSGGDVGKLSDKSVSTSSGPGVKKTTFDDVAGISAAKEVVEEVADFMRNPDRYTKIGARLPTGILLVGPPGTGKTMLARAMANEAGLPFFFCSGSDFVEIYAGRGASRVRNLFAKAGKAAPCVVFIDEIDALGKSRSADFSMNEEREQTLNQLLAAMDGFCSEKRIVIMAATNRYDVLDKALVRPGRFDRIVRVDLPNQQGRKEILRVHTKHMRLSEDCDLDEIAKLTYDYTGAELSMICNEAAIRAARDKREVLLSDDFVVAIDTHKMSTKRVEKTGRSGSDFMGIFGVN